MSADKPSVVGAIERALGGEAVSLERKGAGRWERVCLNGHTHRLAIQLADDWLLFAEADDPDSASETEDSLWAALHWNSTGMTPTKMALNPNKRLARCAELLLGGDVALEPRVFRILEAFHNAWEKHPQAATDPPANWAKEVERLCGESGWGCVVRASGRLTVALATTPPLQAAVTPVGPGLRLSTEAFDMRSFTPVSRLAAALLAFQIAGCIPLVRATSDPSRSHLAFEAVLAAPPTTGELDAACGGLSLIAARAGEALSALQFEDLARDYLAVRGWTAQQQKPETERKHT